MKRYTFNNGYVVTSELSAEELMNRMRRLDVLRVLTEQHECKEGQSICAKAWKAYNKQDNFTGIIRLTFLEKDWLGCMLESDMLDEEDIECIKFYCRIK